MSIRKIPSKILVLYQNEPLPNTHYPPKVIVLKLFLLFRNDKNILAQLVLKFKNAVLLA